MIALPDIPPEILEQILLELDPVDVSAVSQTCVLFSELIYGSSSEPFWRQLYLCMPLDDPRQCIDILGLSLADKPVAWRTRLQRIIRARTVLRGSDTLLRSLDTDERVKILRTLIELAICTVPLNSKYDDNLSLNLVWLGSLLMSGKWFEYLHSITDTTEEERQLRDRLHTLYGLILEDYNPRRRVDTRCVVYALSQYTEHNTYGPFMKDGSGNVDWERMLAVQHVMSMHIVPRRLFANVPRNAYIGSPMSLPFSNSVIEKDLQLDNVSDWAGIDGTWECGFCYCDYRDLLVFNNFNATGTELRRELFENPDFVEEFTVYQFTIHYKSAEHDEAHPTRPKLFFEGSTNSNFMMEGYVSVTNDNNIRWHFTSNHMWRVEGVQVGGVRSLYGVLGVWTTAHHDPNDPVGPFWMRKVET